MIDILVDTNVIIYAFDETSSFFEQASGLLKNEEMNLFFTTKNISEFFVFVQNLN